MCRVRGLVWLDTEVGKRLQDLDFLLLGPLQLKPRAMTRRFVFRHLAQGPDGAPHDL
jgi:hypothetical protein